MINGTPQVMDLAIDPHEGLIKMPAPTRIGTVMNTSLNEGSLQSGYATVGTDTGHQGHPADGRWALNDLEAIVNFGHLAVHRTAVTAKALTNAYYKKPISRSYFTGCSRGGGQAIMSALRYPEDFDAVAAGGVRPAVLFLARFANEGFAHRTPPRIACELIKATNVLTLELNDFMWYSAALDLLWPGETADVGDSVEALTRNTPCYSLGIDRTAGVGPVVDRVLGCLDGQAEPRPEPMMER